MVRDFFSGKKEMIVGGRRNHVDLLLGESLVGSNN